MLSYMNVYVTNCQNKDFEQLVRMDQFTLGLPSESKNIGKNAFMNFKHIITVAIYIIHSFNPFFFKKKKRVD